MSKIVNFRLPAESFTAVKAMRRGKISARAATLLKGFVDGQIEVTDREPNTYVSTSISLDDNLFQQAKDKATSEGLSLQFVIARLLEMEAHNELNGASVVSIAQG